MFKTIFNKLTSLDRERHEGQMWVYITLLLNLNLLEKKVCVQHEIQYNACY